MDVKLSNTVNNELIWSILINDIRNDDPQPYD